MEYKPVQSNRQCPSRLANNRIESTHAPSSAVMSPQGATHSETLGGSSEWCELPKPISGMSWFKENAAAIQALSSVAGILVAGVLAWLTYRYVRHTRDIAMSSLEQVKHIRGAARISQRQSAHALKSLARCVSE